MKDINELIEETKKIIEDYEDFSTVAHLFSDDKSVADMARIRRNLCTLLVKIKLSKTTEIKPPTKKVVSNHIKRVQLNI